MQLKNSPEKYGAVSKTFHWLTSITVLCLLGVGLYMVRADKNAALIPIYGLHKSFGILVLTATFFRVLWHVYSKKPPLVRGMALWERVAAHAGHFFLYICLFGMPLSGWIMSSAFGRTVTVFGVLPLPNLVEKNDGLAENLSALHEYLAYALIGMIAVHIGAALKHHFISKDATLKRMLPFGRP
ncbi:MAG: Cytochrome [Alphaproteobacteria bacterium]|jgi:cytochrome b561|nr:Cytochrome [Alphaproteobacteria bacterium]